MFGKRLLLENTVGYVDSPCGWSHQDMVGPWQHLVTIPCRRNRNENEPGLTLTLWFLRWNLRVHYKTLQLYALGLKRRRTGNVSQCGATALGTILAIRNYGEAGAVSSVWPWVKAALRHRNFTEKRSCPCWVLKAWPEGLFIWCNPT